MPPAFVLSQDQTLKLCHTPIRHGENPIDLTGMSFKEPIPALSNVMDTNEHACHPGRRGACDRMWHRLELTGYRSLEVPGPGAVAHMSLHQKPTMSKNRQTVIADSDRFPDLHRGTGYPNLLATVASGAGRNRQRRVGEGHIWAASDSVNAFLQFYFTEAQEPQKFAIFLLFPRRSPQPSPTRITRAKRPTTAIHHRKAAAPPPEVR